MSHITTPHSYPIIADLHTHTIASDHAYSTVQENAAAAALAGMRAIAMTDHGPALPDAPNPWYFDSMGVIPDYVGGVRVYKGAEANIKALDGSLDLSEHTLKHLEWVIASMHGPTCPHGTPEEITDCWLRVAADPLVDCIGHCGSEEYLFDYRRGIEAFAKYGKIVEINNHSFDVRRGAGEHCGSIARLCMEYGVRVVLTSDAHFSSQVGVFGHSEAILEECNFPEELILNASWERLEEYMLGRNHPGHSVACPSKEGNISAT